MTDVNLRIRQMSLDLSSPNHIPLNVRIAEFRQDPQNMDQMTEFVDDVINKAQTEANKRLDATNKVGVSFVACVYVPFFASMQSYVLKASQYSHITCDIYCLFSCRLKQRRTEKVNFL